MKQMTPAPSARPKLAFDEREIEGDVVTRFERVVDAVPDAIAIRADGTAWRYRDLDAFRAASEARVKLDSLDPGAFRYTISSREIAFA